jgi:hypothetical protein
VQSRITEAKEEGGLHVLPNEPSLWNPVKYCKLTPLIFHESPLWGRVSMRFTFPHFEMKPKAVQPDYEKWQAVHEGMTREEVIGLLDEPRTDDFLAANSPVLCYGFIQLPFVHHPRTYCFYVWLQHGRVTGKVDPFNGNFSSDGLPTKPELIVPQEMQVFSHHPHVIDIRWFPVSGNYPITYMVQMGSFPFPQLDGAPLGFDRIDGIYASDLIGPYVVTDFGSAGPRRIRVRARNELGASEWSDYRMFHFTVNRETSTAPPQCIDERSGRSFRLHHAPVRS